MRLKLGAPKTKGLPSICSPLLENTSHGQLACICGEGEVGTWDGMVKECSRCQSRLDGVERVLTLLSPVEGLWKLDLMLPVLLVCGSSFETAKEVEEMLCCMRDEASIIIDHPQK